MLDAELPDNLQRVAHALGVAGAVGHDHAQHVLRAKRLGGERGHQAGVDAAAQSQHDPFEADLAHLVLDEPDQDLPDQLRVDLERREDRFRKACGCAHARLGEAR